MYSVEFSRTAEKQLYKLEREAQKRIISVLERIKIRPFHFVKRKQGTPYFILRIGNYRAILDINQKKFIIQKFFENQRLWALDNCFAIVEISVSKSPTNHTL